MGERRVSKPKVGDLVRVPRYMFGRLVEMCEFKLEQFHYCLGFFQSEAHKADGSFTPLCELIEPAPDAELKYWSHYGQYTDKKIQTYEIISSQ